MIAAPPPDSPPQPPRGESLGGILRRDAAALVSATAGTVLVGCGVYVLGRGVGSGRAFSCLAALAALACWTALAAPVLAAGGRGWLSRVLRGGIVADAGGVALALLCLAAGPCLTLLAAVEIYCVLGAMALASVAAVSSAAWVSSYVAR